MLFNKGSIIINSLLLMPDWFPSYAIKVINPPFSTSTHPPYTGSGRGSVGQLTWAVGLPALWSHLQSARLDGRARGERQISNMPPLQGSRAICQTGTRTGERILYRWWPTVTCICALWSYHFGENHKVTIDSHMLHYIVAIIGFCFQWPALCCWKTIILYYLWHVMLIKLHMWLAMLSIRMLYIDLSTDELPEADMFQWVCLSFMRRYWLNVLIPHLASEWIPRCPFCSAALDRNTPTVKLIFS